MNLKPRVCLVVTGKTIDQFLQNLNSAQKLANLIELRIDFIQNLSVSQLNLLRHQTHKPAILTCRPQAEGGHFQGTLTFRINLIKQADRLGFNFIDLELSTLQKHPLKLKKANLIVSYHNFKTTPSLIKLKTLVSQMRLHQPKVKKIATLVKSNQHLQTLLKLLIAKKQSEDMIVVAMGQKAKTSRLIFPMLGSYLTYASFNKFNSAPGQINVQDIKLFYQQLSKL